MEGVCLDPLEHTRAHAKNSLHTPRRVLTGAKMGVHTSVHVHNRACINTLNACIHLSPCAHAEAYMGTNV